MSKIEELLLQVCKNHCAFYTNCEPYKCGWRRKRTYCNKALSWKVNCDSIAPEEVKFYTV